jgi:hypothetical protein
VAKRSNDDYLYGKPENFYLREKLRKTYNEFCGVEPPGERDETFRSILKDLFGLVDKPTQAEGM